MSRQALWPRAPLIRLFARADRDSVTMPGVRRSRFLILYLFHPRAGQMVQVEHRKRFVGEDHLVVVQPTGHSP